MSHQFWPCCVSVMTCAVAGPSGGSCVGGPGIGSIGVPVPFANAAVVSEVARAAAVASERIRFMNFVLQTIEAGFMPRISRRQRINAAAQENIPEKTPRPYGCC
jgi:hypothetical protein